MDYAQYLKLDRLLGALEPLTDAPDEPMFIVAHHVSELWMALLLRELDDARRALSGDELRFAFRALTRATRILEQMARVWDVLATMTPADYMRFRHALGSSSGFQSVQYRLVEFALGARNTLMIQTASERAEDRARLTAELGRPSLYDESLRLLARRGFALPAPTLDRDLTNAHEPHHAVQAAWAAIYADTSLHWDLYELAEKLVDVEHRVRLWRFAHLSTVERIIGGKRGTGGTAGVGYLEAVLKARFFPELIGVRTSL